MPPSMRHTPWKTAGPARRTPTVALLTALLVALVACGPTTRACEPLPLSAEAARELEEATQALDFSPVAPCAFAPGFEVAAVFVDQLPAAAPASRISFEVTRGGSRVYLLSHTRAEVPFSAIPQGSHHLRVTLAGERSIEAAGFAGPAGTGDDIAYLRWRVEGVTTELAATLSPTFTEAEFIRLARALLAATR